MKSTVASKLRRMLMLTTGGILFLAALIFIVLEAISARYYLNERINTLSTFLSINIRTSLEFDDSTAGNEILQALSAEDDLVATYVYRADGTLFAYYKANAEAGSTEALPPDPSFQLRTTLFDSQRFNGRFYEYVQSIRIDEKLIGKVYFQYSLAAVEKHLMVYLVVLTIIYLFTMLAIYGLAFKLQRRISGPIERILEAIQAITLKQHYGVRIRQGEDDEIGAIITGFNKMIENIGFNHQELEQQRLEIEKHVFYDSLTGLPNRRLLIDKAEQEISRSKRSRQKGALLFLDLDHFKTINDTLGHVIGDELLKTVSARIRNVVREVDTPARLGGDEFVVLLPDVGREEVKACNNALNVAEKVRKAISSCYRFNDRMLHVTPSIGIVLFDADNCHFETLLKQADLAMYHAKDEGRNQVRFFAPHMQDSAEHRQAIEERLHAALLNNELQLFYQPQVDSEGSVISAEVLVRLKEADGAWLNPATFIPIAELSDLICSIDRWILKAACQHLSIWERKGMLLPLAVNISARAFNQTDFVEQVQDIIISTSVNPENLVIELTEGVLINDIELTIDKMNRLRAMGIKFSIDDFGTGYSSLRYLNELPLSTLKIDQSFIRGITSNSNAAAIITTILGMSRSLGFKVIAEGVEKEKEFDFLKKNGCNFFQGFLFYKPIPFIEMNRLLCSLKTVRPKVIEIKSDDTSSVFD